MNACRADFLSDLLEGTSLTDRLRSYYTDNEQSSDFRGNDDGGPSAVVQLHLEAAGMVDSYASRRAAIQAVRLRSDFSLVSNFRPPPFGQTPA